MSWHLPVAAAPPAGTVQEWLALADGPWCADSKAEQQWRLQGQDIAYQVGVSCVIIQHQRWLGQVALGTLRIIRSNQKSSPQVISAQHLAAKYNDMLLWLLLLLQLDNHPCCARVQPA